MKNRAIRTVVLCAWLAGTVGYGFQALPGLRPLDGNGQSTKPVHISGEVSGGYLSGLAHEMVYEHGLRGHRETVSQLDWQLENIFMLGGKASVRILDRLSFNAAMWLAVTEGSGEMRDYDWLVDGASEWSDFSLSDVDVTEGYAFDMNVSVDVIRWQAVNVFVLGGYKQSGWTWEDSGRYALYTVDRWRDTRFDLHGDNMITYEQEFQMPYIGAGVDIQWRGLTVSAYGIFSDWVYAYDWDDHWARELRFEEEFEDGRMYGFGVKATYQFQGGFFVSGAFDYQKNKLTVGDMYVTENGTDWYWDKDVAGIDNRVSMFSFAAGFVF